ncbi:MAG: tetratricopeptide repeat protein [Burkholderiales bacterium]|nr:tetratricopeptide repeat protein [Burkholderiales bacterium]
MSSAQSPVQDRNQHRARQSWQEGRDLARKGKWEQAAKAFRAAAALAPHDALYVLNEAQALASAGRNEEALACARRAVEMEPASELARLMVARQHLQRHEFADAIDCLTALPAATPRGREYWEQLGLARQHAGQHQEAIDAFMQALSHKLDEGPTHFRLGLSFYELHLKEEAAECFRTALLLGVGTQELHLRGMLAFAERENCRWDHVREEQARIDEILARLPDNAAVMTTPFAHLSLADDPLAQLKVGRAFAHTFAGVPQLKWRQEPLAGRRIRIGYVSGDFYQHATAVLMAEMLERRDAGRFEVFLYSHGKDDRSPMRQRIINAADHFIEVAGLDDTRAAQRICDDGIDILVDLKGYTAGNRIGIFARRPAPLQVSFLGFPGTTGASFLDYVVGDPTVTPLAHAAHYTEKIAQMPVCYQPNDRQRPLPLPTPRELCDLPRDALVLCGFNQAYKISPEVLDVWCGLLRDLPQAVLWLLDWHPQARPNLTRELQARGIADERVIWAPKMTLADHITRLARADIFLDAWPYNAHTTASDALWAGVPVVTFTGQSFASRVASSLVAAAGVPELACADLDGYRQRVLELAADPARRRELSERLIANRQTAPLFDGERYARDFEALLLRMLDRQQQGLPADHLPAQAH